MLIGINGYSSSGKDTLGSIIQELSPNKRWEIKKFAGKLKVVANLLTGIDIENFEDQDFKKTNLGREWAIHGMPMIVRDFLQKLGTDGLREGLHPDVWVNALMADYRCVPADRAPWGWDCDNWIITDTRFPNEAKAIKERGGILINISRPGVKPINNHPSETSLDDWKFDYKIYNSGDITNLKILTEEVLKDANIIYHEFSKSEI